MNIKIEKNVCETLMQHTLDTVEFGNTTGKDKDLLHIINLNTAMDYSVVDNNHTLFYKDEDNKTDHLFITPRGYINGIVTGSNTLFFEVLVDGLLKGTCLEFLEEYISDFMTFKLMKALIGCAIRDEKQSHKHKDPEKKRKWALEYANMVCKSISMSTVEDHELDKEMLGYIRDELVSVYEQGDISWSVPYDVMKEINIYLTGGFEVRFFDFKTTEAIQKAYYNTWSENK